ncbi:MAG: glycosyltransferase, partial [bacterium]|nr:glycosyltransferase [Candidatus Colisoma equi]
MKVFVSLKGRIKLALLDGLWRLGVIDEKRHWMSMARNIVRHSPLFDANWYFAQYPEVVRSGRDPADHYCFVGWKKGFLPSLLFDGNAYLAANPDVRLAKRNPLVHYVLIGFSQQRPLKPSAKPVAKSMSKRASGVANASGELKRDIAIVARSPLFVAAWYLRRYPDVAKMKIDPVKHYCMAGWKEGRQPGPNFDGKAYLEANPDVKKAGKNPLVHYVLYGQKEKRPLKPVAKVAAPAKPLPITKSSPTQSVRKTMFTKLKECFAYRPKISVIVASYNYEKYIGETLDSILAQTYDKYEVIVIDDGSKDNSVEVIRKYAARSKKIKLYQHEGGVNKGLPATVKLGVEKASGDYIAFCESDDLWMPTNLEEKVVLIRKSKRKAKVIINDIKTFGDPNRCRQLETIVVHRMKRLDKVENIISPEEFREKNWICTFSCCMVERKLLASCNFLSTPRPSNLDWWLWRQICYENAIYVVRNKLTCWRCHQSYMTRESVDTIVRTYDFHDALDALLVDSHPGIENQLSRAVRESRSIEVRDGVLWRDGKQSARQPAFSIIMPTYNRAHCICTAIDSVLRQTYQNFTLIIVDDGSVDNTKDVIAQKYSKQIAEGRIKYKRVSNGGVCKARNKGLKLVHTAWIAYLDSDNYWHERFLEFFSRAILLNPNREAFYAQQIYLQRKRIVGQAFDRERLQDENYIDLGVFVHSKDLYRRLGGFDERMTRLVDWELIIRYMKKVTPCFIKRIVMYYDDADRKDRITISANLHKNLAYIRRKHGKNPLETLVTTMVTTYNHAPYLRMALDNAVCQFGMFKSEILISDDGSTDGTRDIVSEYAERFPDLVRDISSNCNLGISANMKKCFEKASGKYIAVLEGDDYWVNPYKLKKQVAFLEANPDCSMVFSRPKVNRDGIISLLPRHEGLPRKLTGR